MPLPNDSISSLVDLLERATSTNDFDATLRRCRTVANAVRREISARRASALAQGREAQAALYDYLSEQFTRTDPGNEDHTDPDRLLESMIERSADESLLATFLAIRRNADWLGTDLFLRTAMITRTKRPDLLDAGISFAIAATRATGDDRWWDQATLMWAAKCRDDGRDDRAAWHRERMKRRNGAHELEPGVHALEGIEHLRRNDFRSALASFTAAVHDSEASGQRAVPQFQYYRAGCMRHLGRWGDAVAVLNDAIRSFSTPLHDDPDWLGKCYLLRGLVLEDLGDLENASPDYELAANHFTAAGNHKNAFKARTDLAANEMKRDRPDLAVRSFRRIRDDVNRFGDVDLRAAAHNNLAHALMQDERPRAAFVEYGEALALREDLHDHRTAISLLGLGDALKEQGNHEGANVLYSLALFEGVYSDELIAVLSSYLSRVDPASDGCAEPALLETLFRGTVTSTIAQGAAQETMLLQLGWGQYLEKRELYADAASWYRTCLEESMKLRYTGHLVDDLRIRRAETVARNKDGMQEALDIALDLIAAADAQSTQSVLSESIGQISSDTRSAYDLAITLLLRDDIDLRLPDSRSRVEFGFDLHEAARSRGFLSALTLAPLEPDPAVGRDLIAAEGQLIDEVRALEVFDATKTVARGRDAQLSRLRRAKESLAVVHASMATVDPEYVRLRAGSPVRLSQVIAMLADLPDPPTLVSFQCLDQKVVCHLLHPDGTLKTYAVPIGRVELQDMSNDLRAAFNGDPAAFPPTRPPRRNKPGRRPMEFSRRGGELLPFLEDLTPGTLLCVLPNEALHALPLHAAEMAPGRPLAMDYPVFYSPSLSTLMYTARRLTEQSPSRSALVVGAAAVEDSRQDFFENDEEMFAGNWAVEVVHGEDASRAELLHRVSQPLDVLHICCHGHMDAARSSRRSGLLLSDGAARPSMRAIGSYDMAIGRHLVTAGDLAGSHLNARLVTLRSCSAGLQRRLRSGDDLVGFVRSVLYAGASSVRVHSRVRLSWTVAS